MSSSNVFLSRNHNLDAADSVFFARELESQDKRIYEVVQAPLKAFEIFPVDSSDSEGAEVVSYRQYDQTGIAKVIANYADDLPTVNVTGKEYFNSVKSIGDSYWYSIQDLRAARLAGRPLDTMLATVAINAMRREWNRIAFYGDNAHNLKGFFNNGNIPTGSVPVGAGASTLWASKTPDEILKDLNTMTDSVMILTNGAEAINTIVLPVAQYSLISTVARSSTSDTTILEFFLKNRPGMTVTWANELSSAQMTANGVTGFTGNVMIGMRRSPEVLQLKMPVMFERMPAQEVNLAYKVPCHSRIGGLVIRYPFAIVIRDSI